MSALPTPSKESQMRSQILREMIQKNILNHSGWISFEDFMHQALYAPSIGYYSGGTQKFAEIANGGGDFITAPEISPLFGQTLAWQAAQVIKETQGNILELGAGTGILAAELLHTLSELVQLPAQYFILEVSDHLREVQKELLEEKLSKDLFKRVVWLATMPDSFNGLVLGNEVLDAIPVNLIVNKNNILYERGVVFNQKFNWQDRPLEDSALTELVTELNLSNDYLTEVCPASVGLIRSLASMLEQGAIIMIDYGFSAKEYYHPQRDQGTLMCHFQHYAHSDPLINVGLQDITAHVNFTAIAQAGYEEGLTVHGYCNQANFLFNCGVLDILEASPASDIATYLPLSTAVQRLVSPAEMGELFKVIALTKKIDVPLMGFVSGDKTHTL